MAQYKCFGKIFILNIREFCSKELYESGRGLWGGGRGACVDRVRKFKIIIIIIMMMIIMIIIIIFIMNRVNVFVNPHCTSLHKHVLLLLDEVEHDIMNYQNRGMCYLPKPKAEADNTDTRF